MSKRIGSEKRAKKWVVKNEQKTVVKTGKKNEGCGVVKTQRIKGLYTSAVFFVLLSSVVV
jgi:hypothetical protein